MKKYLALVYMSVMESLHYRLGALVTVIGNFIYIAIIYNLWKSIYRSTGTVIINGLSFQDTMIYLVLASALTTTLDSYLVWRMSEDIQSGKITLDLLKPISYFSMKASVYFGQIIFSFIVTFIPTFFAVYFLSGKGFELGWNMLFFLVSIIFSAILNISFDFCVGSIGFYTQSIWGVNTFKEVIVMLFSGTLIPLNFFPETLIKLVMYLPFQAMYNIPMQQLINKDLMLSERFTYMLIQVVWILVIGIAGKLFWNHSLKVLTVNGG